MNELWIEHGHKSAKIIKNDLKSDSFIVNWEYYDIMGLFETSWLVYDHKNEDKGGFFDYGYYK